MAHHGCGSFNGSEVCYHHCSVFCGLCVPLQQASLCGADSLRGLSLVTQILLVFLSASCSPDACHREMVNARYGLLQPPCILIFPSPEGIWTFRGGRVIQYTGRAPCRVQISLEGKVGTQMEGIECEISILMSLQQLVKSRCFHCMKWRPQAG